MIILGGLESTKEESYLFENRCLARGLATCTFDGPGQGEMYFQAKMRADFHRFASKVLDWLEQRPEIDPDRIGIIGRSLGGFYAVHTAAHEPRLKACVCWGALFDLSYYDAMAEPSRHGFAYVAGYNDDVSAAPFLKKTLDLAGQAELVRCPIYVLHGALDRLISFPRRRLSAFEKRSPVIPTWKSTSPRMVTTVVTTSITWSARAWPTGLPKDWAAIFSR